MFGEDGWRSIRGFFQVLLSSERRERVRSIDFYRRQKFRASRRTAANRVFPVNIVTRVLATRYHRNSVPARSTNRSLTGGIARNSIPPVLACPSLLLLFSPPRKETTRDHAFIANRLAKIRSVLKKIRGKIVGS